MRKLEKYDDQGSSILVNRRKALGLAAASVAIAAVGLPINDSFATAEAVEEKIGEITGGASVSDGGIKLKTPEIAENGGTVPIGFEVESAMTDSDYVKSVHILATENPLPRVVSFSFTPSSGRAAATVRIRLAKTQNVIALAEMSDGSFKRAANPVKVTIGGCGG